MLHNMKKIFKYYIILFCIAFILLLIISSSTSPLYNVFWGDYLGNQTSGNLIIGKGWLRGKVPYRDLFGTGGPLYYLIQSIGWFIAGRTGIFILQTIQFGLFLCINFLMLSRYKNYFVAMGYTCCLAISYIAMASSGNSESEWCLFLISAAIYVSLHVCQNMVLSKTLSFLMGICAGALFMIWFRAIGISFGICIFVWYFIYITKKNKNACCKLLCNIAGILVVTIPFAIYFALNGCIGDFLYGHILYHFKEFAIGSETIILILRKVIKCVPIWIAFAASIIYGIKRDRKISIFLIITELFILAALIPGRGLWHYYLICTPFMSVIVILLKDSFEKKKFLMLQILAIIITFAVWLIPAKSCITNLVSSDKSNLDTLTTDIQNNLKEKKLEKIFVIDKPASLYLALDQIPEYKYFAYQKDLWHVDSRIYDDMYTYITQNYTDGILLYGTNGWMEEWIGPYQMVTIYPYEERQSIAIYLYNMEEMPEEEIHIEE